jgi:hypothetical protein
MVLGVSVLVAVIGIGALLTARVATRATAGGNDAAEADALALSAIEQALALMNAHPNWRTAYQSGQESPPQALGRGTFTWRVVDELNGDLADDPAQPVRLYGTGSVGQARRVYSVMLRPDGPALEVLKKAAHGDAAFTVNSLATVNATGGPLSTDGEFRADGNVKADVEATNCSGGGFQGAMNKDVKPRAMPSPSALDLYLFRATAIAWNRVEGGLSGALGPGVNPYGAGNREGIYHVSVPAFGQLRIDNARLSATLLVTAGPGARVKVGPSVLWEPPHPYLPSLIVRGTDVKVDLDSSPTGVSELLAGQSLNPSGMPYNGSSDNDALDTYPSELRGLFHVGGKSAAVVVGANLRMNGVLLTDGTITAGDSVLNVTVNASFAADPRIYSDPPAGYTLGERMVPVEGTWERRPSPAGR